MVSACSPNGEALSSDAGRSRERTRESRARSPAFKRVCPELLSLTVPLSLASAVLDYKHAVEVDDSFGEKSARIDCTREADAVCISNLPESSGGVNALG